MPERTYRGRRATSIENDHLRVTVLHEGGHIAEVFDKTAAVNPLWAPPWASCEPSAWDRSRHSEYGEGSDATLLAGIMGHNACLDIFGGPSEEEAAAGLPAHGEASVVPYRIEERGQSMIARAELPQAQLRFERWLTIRDRRVAVREAVQNLSACDRPIAWTQHVTLGPPFLEIGLTQFRASATRSKVFEGAFGVADYLEASAEFDWPFAPRPTGGVADLRMLSQASPSSGYTAHLMDQRQEHAFFVAHSSRFSMSFGYVWKTRDFPWMGIWEENLSRTSAPWNGRTLARGMEFGVSPMPESRRTMIARGTLFGVPAYRWIPARTQLVAEYTIVTGREDTVPAAIGPLA